MKVLGVFLTLCTILTLSQALPFTSTVGWFKGQCEAQRQRCRNLFGEYCPQCDAEGNYLPQQCWPSTGYCWCVNIYTGEKIPGTETPAGKKLRCGKNKTCPDGWSSFGDKCFLYVSAPKKWTEAEVYCRFDGANLASIHSEEENHFIMSLSRGHTQDFPQTWLGGFDVIHPGYWMWSDGSDFSYQNWYDDDSDEKDIDEKDDDDNEADDDDEKPHKHNERHGDDDDDDDDSHKKKHKKDDDDDDDDDDSHKKKHKKDDDGDDEDDDDDDSHEKKHKKDDDGDDEDDDDDDSHEKKHKKDHDDDDEDDDDDSHKKKHKKDDDDNDDDDDDDDDDHDEKKHKKPGRVKYCLRINYEYDLKWFHASCTDSFPFVCAKNADDED